MTLYQVSAASAQIEATAGDKLKVGPKHLPDYGKVSAILIGVCRELYPLY